MARSRQVVLAAQPAGRAHGLDAPVGMAHGRAAHAREVAREDREDVGADEVAECSLEPRLLGEPLGGLLVQHVADRDHAPPAGRLRREELAVFRPRDGADETDESVGRERVDALPCCRDVEPFRDAVEHRDLVLRRHAPGEHHEIDGVEQVVRLRRLRAEVVADVGVPPGRVEQQDAHHSLRGSTPSLRGSGRGSRLASKSVPSTSARAES